MGHPQLFSMLVEGCTKDALSPPPHVPLMVEGLSMLFKDAMRGGLVRGVKTCDDMAMSHLLVVTTS